MEAAVEVVAAEGRPRPLSKPGKVLQRSTRNLRFANLSLPGSRASISSTHSRSCSAQAGVNCEDA